MNILLPITIFVAWLAFAVVPAGPKAIEDAKQGVPDDQTQGTSIMPLFPVLPLAMWGIAWLINRRYATWGNWGMLWLHAAILLLSLIFIVRDIIRLKAITKEMPNQTNGH